MSDFTILQSRTSATSSSLVRASARPFRIWLPKPVSVCGEIPTVSSEIERGICLAIFSVRICQLTNEVRFIAPLRPRLTQIETNRSRRPTDLCGQSKLFLWRKTLAQFEDLHSELIGELVHG